jgi:hypothetical protein
LLTVRINASVNLYSTGWFDRQRRSAPLNSLDYDGWAAAGNPGWSARELGHLPHDNLELSEQFDATTGYEKSVSNLSWSYASFLSAVRVRTAI